MSHARASRPRWGPGCLAGALLIATPPTPARATSEPKRDYHWIAWELDAEARAEAQRREHTDDRKPRRSTRADASRLPSMRSPSVHAAPSEARTPAVGSAAALSEPRFSDRRRRMPDTPLPSPYVDTLRVGERFGFDVYFAGNPAGFVEAGIATYQADPRGDAPHGSGRYELEGVAVTSGVLSMLASMEDRMTTWVDAGSGAVISSTNTLARSGLLVGKAEERVTESEFEGRGLVRVTYAKNGRAYTSQQQIPRDTFDPLSSIAWMRALELEVGGVATAHVLDGRTLMQIDVVNRGQVRLEPLPSVARGLGVEADDVYLLEGTLSKVDDRLVVEADAQRNGFRLYLTRDPRRLVLVLETDVWAGVLRLVLNRYDPPG